MEKETAQKRQAWLLMMLKGIQKSIESSNVYSKELESLSELKQDVINRGDTVIVHQCAATWPLAPISDCHIISPLKLEIISNSTWEMSLTVKLLDPALQPVLFAASTHCEIVCEPVKVLTKMPAQHSILLQTHIVPANVRDAKSILHAFVSFDNPELKPIYVGSVLLNLHDCMSGGQHHGDHCASDIDALPLFHHKYLPIYGPMNHEFLTSLENAEVSSTDELSAVVHIWSCSPLRLRAMCRQIEDMLKKKSIPHGSWTAHSIEEESTLIQEASNCLTHEVDALLAWTQGLLDERAVAVGAHATDSVPGQGMMIDIDVPQLQHQALESIAHTDQVIIQLLQ